MMPLECADEWIEAVKKGLKPGDPLYDKDIFVSGRHETNQLLLIENDTDNNYAIVAIVFNEATQLFDCSTVDLLQSRIELANKLHQDHENSINQ